MDKQGSYQLVGERSAECDHNACREGSFLLPCPFSQQQTRMRETMEGNGTRPSITMETFGNQEGQPEVALQTVLIMLKNGNRRIMVNCLLDEGSDTTYVNEDVVNELRLTGKKEPITVEVANDQILRFMSSSLRLALRVLTAG